MLRLFTSLWLLVLVSAGLAFGTNSRYLHWLTLCIVVLNLSLYFYFRRSVPYRRGTLHLAGLQGQVEIYLDERGVPHIYANSLEDLYFAQGYMTAQDRLWSMDFNRRVAAGKLAEVFGAGVLAVDKHFRTIGLHRAAEASLVSSSDDSRVALDAYAAGVNARIAEGRLPPEFLLKGYRPEPWTPADTLLIGKFAAYALLGNWDRELFRAQLVQAVGAEKAAELFWLAPDADLLKTLEETPLPDVAELLNIALAFTSQSSGSNGWVVGGTKTRSGAPILANDPHMSVSAPALWYQTHLVGPGGLDVIGVTFPGVPGVLLGHNRDIAWGATNLGADAQDLFLEKVNPAAPDEFLYEDLWEKADRIAEPIRVRGQHEPVVHEVLVTRHGPIIARGEETALALRWTALDASDELGAFLSLNRARNWPEFRQALEGFAAPTQHFLFAGRDGTIAWRAGGKIPLRPRGDGQAPVPGWTGAYEWTGCIPFAEMPESVNPPEGFVVAANLDAPGVGSLGSGWVPPYRTQRTVEQLTAAGALTVEHMLQMQADPVNGHARSLLQILLNAVEEGQRQGIHMEQLTPLEKRALLMLSGWNCVEETAAPEPILWHQWYLFLLEGIFRPQIGLTLFDQFVACGLPMQVADRLIRQVAEGGESLWLCREGERSLGRVALRSFKRAVQFMAAKHGQNFERWRWGREHTISFAHALGRRSKVYRRAFTLGPFPFGGSAVTLNNEGFSQINSFQVSVAPVWRQVVDMAMREEGHDILAPGQCGHPLSPHYSDQLNVWLKGDTQVQIVRHKDLQDLPCLVLKPSR